MRGRGTAVGYLPPRRKFIDVSDVFLSTARLWDCPVEGCRGHEVTRTALRVYIFHRHIRDTVVILE